MCKLLIVVGEVGSSSVDTRKATRAARHFPCFTLERFEVDADASQRRLDLNDLAVFGLGRVLHRCPRGAA